MPDLEWIPATAAELSRIVSDNAQSAKNKLLPVGGRTALNMGYPLPSETAFLSVTELNRIVDYPARDMTITVEAGIRIEALQEQLLHENQRLPIDIPQAGRATLGGAIACNTSGPGRFGYGTFRDYVIGITAVDAKGRLFSAGGRVVKNVAGYDLCKLLVGSLGTLAVITSVTLKLRPVSSTRKLLVAALRPGTAEAVLADLNHSATRPFAIDLLNAKATWQVQGETNLSLPDRTDTLVLGFEGTQREVDWQIEKVQAELQSHQPSEIFVLTDDQQAKLYDALVEFQTASDDPLTFQASLPPSKSVEFLSRCSDANMAAQVHAGSGIINGHLSDRCTSARQAIDEIAPLRKHAEASTGALKIMHCEQNWKNDLLLDDEPTPAWKLMSGIKHQLDPDGLLSPRRIT